MTGRRKTPHESGNRWNGGCKCTNRVNQCYGDISTVRVRLSISRSVFRLGENTCFDEMKARQARHYPSDCQRVYAVFKSAKGVYVDR
jgi:hypothetical protein